MEARFYDPTAGAFISRDSADVANRYAYAQGNPLLGIDRTGHYAGTADATLSGAKKALESSAANWALRFSAASNWEAKG